MTFPSKPDWHVLQVDAEYVDNALAESQAYARSSRDVPEARPSCPSGKEAKPFHPSRACAFEQYLKGPQAPALPPWLSIEHRWCPGLKVSGALVRPYGWLHTLLAGPGKVGLGYLHEAKPLRFEPWVSFKGFRGPMPTLTEGTWPQLLPRVRAHHRRLMTQSSTYHERSGLT